MTGEKILSYLLVRRENGKAFYWTFGDRGGWTEDLKEARRYARKASAAEARKKLLKRPEMDPEVFNVEAIEE